MQQKFKIVWHDAFREPQVAPNPAYPDGKDVVDPGWRPDLFACETPLPYPARRCGAYVCECEECGFRIAVSTAGRPDDPRSLKFACPKYNAAGRRPH